MPAVPQFKDHAGLVHMQAKQGLRWATGAGTIHTYDDMFQIASVAFVIAAQGYKPETGFKFSTWYTQVVFSEFRREIGIMTGVKNLNPSQREEIIARKAENKQRRGQGLPELPDINYGLAPVSFSDLTAANDEGAIAFEETLTADQMTPEERVEFQQIWEQVTAKLSPLASLMVEWLRDPPEQLLQELRKQEAHADHCTVTGKTVRGMRDGVSIASVIRFVSMVSDVPARQLKRAQKELEQVSEQIEEIYRS